ATTQLFAQDQVEFSYGFVDEVGAVAELVLALPAQARVECSAERAAEVERLLAASLEKLSGRGGPGCLWLRVRHALATDSPKIAALARQLVALAERLDDPFLQYAVYECLLAAGQDANLKSEDRAKAALVTGGLHRRAGELTRAEELLKGGLKGIADEGGQTGRQLVPMAAELTLELGAITRDRNRHTETQTLIAGALERYGEDLPTHLRARLYLDISWALLKLGRTREAANYCELVLKILDGESYPHEVARAYNQLGVVQYEESNYAQSLINLQRALVLREQVGDAMGVARSYNNLSLTYRSLGRLSEAERCLKRSLEAKVKAGDTLGVAVTQLNLGLLAIDQREYQRARACAAECLHVARRYRHRQMEAEAHGLLGEAAMGEGHYQEARDLLLRDLELCRAQNYETERLATLRRIVGLMLKLKNLKEAKQRLEEARELLTTVPSLYEASMLQVFQSEILRADGAHQEARGVLNKAARSFGGMRRYDLQLDCLARRAELEWESGHKSEARVSFQEARELAMRHEIHRLPAFFHELEGRLEESFIGSPAPAATDHKLETLAELLGPGGDLEAGRPGAVLRMVAAVLAAPEVHWMRTPRQRSLALVRGKVSEQAAPSKLQELVSKTKAGRTATSFQTRPFTGVRVRGADVGWLCVKRERPLDEGELAFLLTVAGILSLAGRQAATQVPEESFASEEKEQPGATYGIIGNSPEIREVLRMIEMVKGNDVTILI
ncbi:MAG TPA: tetratricopeptide repeat protein, partial [Candidatus Krumholzibacteria bacterium]|nr:tetratricopeptide repeat protein [Candidatus Krumholzibacteria bacterium]